MTPPVIHLPTLIAACDRATPGEREIIRHGPLVSTVIGTQPLADYYRGVDKPVEQVDADAEFDVLANPETVRALAGFIQDVKAKSLIHPLHGADIFTLLERHGISLEADAREP